MDYFSSFFNDELLNNIVMAFLYIIINMGLMPLPDMKDYWCSEWITQIQFFGDVMSRARFLQIFWMIRVGNDITKESNRAIKRTKYTE
jgi:hypothetical protein